MKKLSGQSLTVQDWFRPETMPLNLEERRSSATMTLGPEMPEITVGDWLQDDEEPGSGIVWRVKTAEEQFGTKTRTVQLEHIVNTLRDDVMFGEVKPADISGGDTCTAKQAIQYILGRQSIWTLGTFDSRYDSVSNPYTFNGETLFAALETVTRSLDDAHWEFDTTALPFQLHILGTDNAVDSEMRMSRNIRTIRRTVDVSRMYTRFYPIGQNNLHIDGDYVSRNESTYGRRCKIETDGSKTTKAELLRWANERIKNHCEPSVTVTVDGLELSRDTGEALDALRVCRKCRVPLPEFSTTILEKISRISWSDKIKEPDKVTVTLANNREDVASILNRQTEKSAGGGRAGAKKNEEDHAWISDTTDHVYLVAEAIIGQGPDGVNWSRVAQLGVDGYGIHGRVTRAEGYMVTLAGNLDMTEERLTVSFENAITSARSEFQMSVQSIRLYVGSAEAAAEIVAQINASTGESEIKLDAQKVYIGNDKSTTVISGKCSLSDVTANYIQSKIADLSVLNVAAISATGNIHTSNGYIAAPYYYIGSGNSLQNMASGIWALRKKPNTNTLQKKDWDDSDWVDVATFSQAVSSWTWGGGSGKINVTALPQNQTKSVKVSIDGYSRITSNGTFTYTVDYENSDGDDVSTGATKSVTVSIEPKSVERKSSGISGTSLGDVSSGSGSYVTFTVGGSKYYLKIA